MTIKNYIEQHRYFGYDKNWWFEIVYPKKCQHCGIIYDNGCVSAMSPNEFGAFLFIASQNWFCEECQGFRPMPRSEPPKA